MHTLPLTDLVVFGIYMAGILLFGSSFYRKSASPDTFTLGGGRFPAWVVGMSIFATYVSSISFLALPGKAYQSNWNAFVFSLSIPLAAIVAVRVFVPLYRRLNSPAAYAYLETRFGPWARVYASACYLLTQVMRVGTILYLLALPVHALLGWPIGAVIAVTALAVTIYSVLGGILAVIWTDAVQGIVLISGALICLGYLLFSMPEGPAQTFEIAAEYDKFSLGSFGASLSEPTFWVVLAYGLFINLQNYGIDQNYVQRYKTAGSDQAAKRSAFWGGMLYVPVSLLFLLIGTALFAFYTVHSDELPAAMATGDQSDLVFPYFIVHRLPQGLTGLMIASIFAAGMSTVSTSVNSSATVLLTDYFQRFRKTPLSEQQAMRILYGASAGVGVAGMLVGLAMINVKSALDAWWTLASIFSGGMLGLFLLAAFARKVGRRGAVAGVAAGIVLICWLSLSPLIFADGNWQWAASPFHSYLTIVLGTAVIFGVGWGWRNRGIEELRN